VRLGSKKLAALLVLSPVYIGITVETGESMARGLRVSLLNFGDGERGREVTEKW
jgi:hypothetical protein